MTEEANVEETKPEQGEIAKFLEEKKLKAKSLGVNNSGIEMLELEANDLVQIAKDLKRSKKMTFLSYITALETKESYQAVYQLEDLSDKKIENTTAVVLKVNVAKDKPVIPSLVSVFPTADWQEREAYDMLGIEFDGHPNLTRILNPEDWEGFPLRKDYIGPIDALNEPFNLIKK